MGVGDGVLVGVTVGVTVAVGDGVGEGVGVGVCVGVGLGVGDGVAVGVVVGVGDGVGEGVGLAVGVGVGVGDGVGVGGTEAIVTRTEAGALFSAPSDARYVKVSLPLAPALAAYRSSPATTEAVPFVPCATTEYVRGDDSGSVQDGATFPVAPASMFSVRSRHVGGWLALATTIVIEGVTASGLTPFEARSVKV